MAFSPVSAVDATGSLCGKKIEQGSSELHSHFTQHRKQVSVKALVSYSVKAKVSPHSSVTVIPGMIWVIMLGSEYVRCVPEHYDKDWY